MRVTIASAVALTLTAAVLAVALVATAQARYHSDALAGRLLPADIAADDLAAMFNAEAGLLRAAVTGGQASGLKAVDTAESEARAAAGQVAQIARGDPVMTARAAEVATAYQAWTRNVADPQEAALLRGDAAAAQALQADNALVVPYVTDVRKAVLGLQTEINGEQQSVASSLGRNHDVLLGALIAMIVLAVAVAAAVFISAWRGMLRSLERLATAVGAVADGRYERSIPAAGPAELSDLGRNVEQMRTTLAAALAERERAKENLRRLFDLAPDAVLGVARDGSIVLANAEALRAFGYPAGELIGRDVETLVPEDLRADLAERTEAYFADEQFRATWNATTWSMLRSDGTSFPCGIRMSTLPTEDGAIIIVAVRDGTERVAIEAERERLRAAAEHERTQRWQQQSQRLESLGQLVSGVSHDFNNLLGIISGYTEFTAEELQPLAAEDERLQPLLRDIEQVQTAAQQAIRVTRQLLTFAKSKPADREVLNLNELVDSAGQLLHRALGERIELVVAAGAGLWPVDADRGQLEQVLMNLAVNARDAMPDGGRLTITTTNAEVDDGYAAERPGLKPGRYCRLAVADTGTGMDAETIERVFEPFFSTKPRGHGTGLGLATVYGIVSSLGGLIDISSEKGFGTTVNVLLPVSAQAAAAVPEPSLPAEKARGHGEVILLVEDEHSLRAMAGRLLARNGYVVREAADGDSAVRLVGDPAERVDLLITDVVMPGLLGNEVVDRVRALRPGLPALFITGHAQQVLDFHGITAHDLDIVQKPFTEAALLARVRRALGRPGVPRTTPA